MISTLIYLDVCVLSRPFDDQQQLRIRLETDAVNLILSQVRQGRYALVISPAHRREVEAIAGLYERAALHAMVERYGSPAIVDLALTRQRAEEWA